MLEIFIKEIMKIKYNMSNPIEQSPEQNPYGINLTNRLVVPYAEKLLFSRNNVPGGHITLVDYMGGDETIARVATAGHGLSIFPENPQLPDFLEHLAAKSILEPFKSVQLKFMIQSGIRVALDVVYEPMASVNEYSGRYSDMLDTSFIPLLEMLTIAMKGDKENSNKVLELMKDARAKNYEAYRRLVGEEIDLARELARTPLEIDNDTKYFWKIDLLSLVDFIVRIRSKREEYDPIHPYLDNMEEAARIVAPNATQALIKLEENDVKAIELTLPRDNLIVDALLSPANWKAELTRRVVAREFDDELFKRIQFMENGFVQPVDYMGDDKAPADSARVSYGSGTRRLSTDAGLTRYLVRNRHTTPIEQVEAAFEFSVPVFVDPRQAGRHRTLDRHGFMGYIPIGDSFFVPPVDQLRHQSRTNRQGRGNELSDEVKNEAISLLKASYQREIGLTAKLRELDVPEGIVRGRKGVGFFNRGWRTGDLHNWGHFFSLRLNPHAQKEIQDFARVHFDLMRKLAPTVIGAFEDYLMNSISFTALELSVLASMMDMPTENIDIDDLNLYRPIGFITKKTLGKEVLTREGEELKTKLKTILDLKKGLNIEKLKNGNS